MEELINKDKYLDDLANSPNLYYKKCMDKSEENMHFDAGA